MGAKRGSNGRFAPAAESPADELPPLFDLTVDPIETPADELPPLEPPPVAPAEAEASPDAAPDLAIALARGIDEAVGMAFGAGYRAAPDQVEAVGVAAAPVIRRALAFVHAGQLAESTVPAPLREVAVLAARVWVAWGDTLATIFQRQVSELRERREANDGTAPRSIDGADGRAGRFGRANGHGDGVPAGAATGAADHQDAGQGGPAGGAESAFARLTAIDTGAGRRRSRTR